MHIPKIAKNQVVISQTMIGNIERAKVALQGALDALRMCEPQAQYYAGRYDLAMDEHWDRVTKLRSVSADLQTLEMVAKDQIAQHRKGK